MNKIFAAGLMSLALVLAACRWPGPYPATATPTSTPPGPIETRTLPTDTPTPVQPTPTPTPTPVPVQPTPDLAEQISNVRWQWAELHASGVRSRVPKPANYVLHFYPDGRLEIQMDCNRAGGTYRLAGDRLALGLTRPREACGPESLQGLFVQWLVAVDGAAIEEDRLVLSALDASNRLVFDRPPPVGETTESEQPEQVWFSGPVRVEPSYRPDYADVLSGDTQVMTVFFNDLNVAAWPGNPDPVAAKQTQLVFPVQNEIDLEMELCVMGAVQVTPGARAAVSIQHAGKAWQPELSYDESGYAEIEVCDKAWLPAGMDYDVTLLVVAQRETCCWEAEAGVWIDELEVSARPLRDE